MFFFESGDTEVLKADRNKLFASINGKLTIIPQCLCVTTIVGVSLKSFFFLFYTKQPPEWKSRRLWNDVYLAFVHTAIIYSSRTLHIYNLLHDVFNPLHPDIRMHILHTVLNIFPNVLARRICLTIKRFFSWLSLLYLIEIFYTYRIVWNEPTLLMSLGNLFQRLIDL